MSCIILNFAVLRDDTLICLTQDAVPGGRVCADSGRVRAERAVTACAAVGGRARSRLCIWVSLEPDAPTGRGAVWHAQLCHPLLPAAVRHHPWDLRARHPAGTRITLFNAVYCIPESLQLNREDPRTIMISQLNF